jgi:hypothetical protein
MEQAISLHSHIICGKMVSPGLKSGVKICWMVEPPFMRCIEQRITNSWQCKDNLVLEYALPDVIITVKYLSEERLNPSSIALS